MFAVFRYERKEYPKGIPKHSPGLRQLPWGEFGNEDLPQRGCVTLSGLAWNWVPAPGVASQPQAMLRKPVGLRMTMTGVLVLTPEHIRNY